MKLGKPHTRTEISYGNSYEIHMEKCFLTRYLIGGIDSTLGSHLFNMSYYPFGSQKTAIKLSA